MKCVWTAALLLLAAAALALRLPELEQRPLHADESVHTLKFKGLWDSGIYRYDPDEYHGPSLYYLTLPSAALSGARTFSGTTEITYRIVPVLFGVGLILLLPLLRDGLGSSATLIAGALTASSPAMVFYSRYYIHEMPLVFFTLLLLAAGWRYAQSGRIGWALLSGAALGLMHATKETFVFTLAAMVGAGALNLVWARVFERRQPDLTRIVRPWHLLAAGTVAVLVSITLFSSFFTNAAGPMDSVRTYLPWFNRAQGQSPHIHAWPYYLELLSGFRPGNRPLFSEGLILILAMIDGGAALTRRGLGDTHAGLVRFLAFYTVLLTGIYSAIPYKTPWCLLSFLHGWILLAGVGAAVLLRLAKPVPARFAVAVALCAGIGQLGVQAWRASFPYCDSQRNPYVYAHTLGDLLTLVDEVNALALLDPDHEAMPVRVLVQGGNSWPLPWYLRRFQTVEWIPDPVVDPRFQVVITSPVFHEVIADKLGASHTPAGYFGLRPGRNGMLELWVANDLWKTFLDTRRSDSGTAGGGDPTLAQPTQH